MRRRTNEVLLIDSAPYSTIYVRTSGKP
jgi:hypothetical protein